jgi:hypothetical protein
MFTLIEKHEYVPDCDCADCTRVQRDKLRAFAQDIMQAWPEGDVDGGELQEAALRHGLLERSEPTQQERDENGLDEYDDWYRPTALLSPNVGNQR